MSTSTPRPHTCLVLILALAMLCGLVGRPAPAFAMPPVERTVLPNGLILILCEDHSLPAVTMQLLVKAGSRRDPPGKGGLADITASSVLFGAEGLTYAAVQEELDFMGASLEASADEDSTVIGLRALKRDVPRVLEIMFRQLLRPSFPADEIERERQKVIAAIQGVEDDPLQVAQREFKEGLYTAFPYAHPVAGTVESVQGLKVDDMRAFYEAFYRPNNSLLVIVGDVRGGDIRKMLQPYLSAWKAGPLPPDEPHVAYLNRPRERLVPRKTTQASVVYGKAGVSRGNPDYYRLSVMNYILGGGGFGSRLFEELRVKRGLAYSVDSAFVPHKHGGAFLVILQTKNESAREAVRLLKEQIERVQERGVTAEELQKAKRYLVGSFPMRMDTQAKLAQFLTQVEFFGLGLDYPDRYPSIIEAVTAADVQRVARTYLGSPDYLLVLVGDVPAK